ncbi:MAG: hypothetical protein JWM80_4098 [Cyanobacteria bacterium RYN_339]|nr:hypothetical protein [Cyanobacteria bacterium RYN_339]
MRFVTTALVAGLLLCSLPARAQGKLPPIQERVRLESEGMAARYNPICKRYGLKLPEAMRLATVLGAGTWAKQAREAGIPATKHKALWKDLTALPHPNFDQKTPYNLLAPGHDRWGVTTQEAIKGWSRFGRVIEQQALALNLDPAILGAYVWTESNFDAHQYNASGGMVAVGLGSVQAQDFPQFSVTQLQDPALNMKLTAKEFREKWNPQDMFGTVMDVWYPAWRSGRAIPHMGNAFGYIQLFSNRYFILLDLLGN